MKHKNVNLYHKKSEHSKKKSQNCKKIFIKTHKIENICFHHLVKKHYQTANFRYKKTLPSVKKVINMKTFVVKSH